MGISEKPAIPVSFWEYDRCLKGAPESTVKASKIG